LGAGLIAWSYVFYSDATPFPGLAAVPLCLGAVLIIHSGGSASADTQTRTMIGRLLSSLPAVAIGKISYSVYLWHWPLMVFAHYRFPNFMNAGSIADIASRLLLAAASLIVGALSWRFVERPFRGGTALRKKWQTLASGLATFLVVFGSAKLVSGHAPWFQSWPPDVVKLAKSGRGTPRASLFGPRAPQEQGWPADSHHW
jgi:peptidoglycan/LPS O-acetylase OafA/YrhL